MSNSTVLYFSVLLGIFSEGLTAVIETQQNVMAAVGDNASLKCQLMETKDVLQVTWQKFSPRGDYNVATYNKPFGQTVNPVFKGKVEFVDAGLQSSSIVINNVTEQDEGCYHCLFNSFPDGALTGRTCLQVCELHQPVLHVRASNSTEELVVSCSATGRPAPTVTLRATPQDHNLTDYNSVSVSNTNGTVTVTTTAVLSALHLNSTQVGCTVGVLSGPQIDVLETIPGLKPTSADDLDDQSGSDHGDFNVIWVIGPLVLTVLTVACCVAVFLVIRFKQRKQSQQHRDFEKLGTPIKVSQKTGSSSVTYEDSELRKMSPPEKNRLKKNSNMSAIRNLNFNPWRLFDGRVERTQRSQPSGRLLTDESGNESTAPPRQL